VVFTQGEKNYAVDRGLQALETDYIEKLKLQADVVLGSFILNTLDEFGVVWVMTDIINWWMPPNADMPIIERGFGDGGYEVAGRYTSRSLTLEGAFLVPDPAMVEAARDRLISACNLATTGAWLRTGVGPIRASFVYLSGSIDITTVNTRGRTNFSIGLRAPDPIKYSWNDEEPDGYNFFELPVKNTSTGTTGSRVLENIGTYPSPAIFEITGPFQAPGSLFNRTTQELIIITQSLKGRIAKVLVNKELSFDVISLTDTATLTTTEAHSYSIGDSVFISGVGAPFDGDHFIVSVPTSTTFTYTVSAAEVLPVAFKAFSTDTATLTTTVDHGFSPGDALTVAEVDRLFNTPSAVILSVPTPTSFTYSANRSTPLGLSATLLRSNIATLSTTQPHGFIVGEDVTISGAGVNFNGAYEITAIPSATTFTYAATRTNSREVIQKSMLDDIVTLQTSAPHGFVTDEATNVTGVDLSLNGGYTISDTTADAFSYKRRRATEISVLIKARTNNVATLTTDGAHGFVVGEQVVVENVTVGITLASSYNGLHTITSLPSNTSFTYASIDTEDRVSTAVANGTVRAYSRKIQNRELIGNVATLITDANHGAIFGEQITVSGLGAPFDGAHTVTGIPFSNVINFSQTSANVDLEPPYVLSFVARTPAGVVTLTTQVAHGYTAGQSVRVTGFDDESFNGTFTVANIPSSTKFRFTIPGGGEVVQVDAPSASQVVKDFGFMEMSGAVDSTVVSGGLATVSGSLPFTSSSGSAAVSLEISNRPAAGNAIRPENVEFTPGLTGATSVTNADILEIDTKDHVVSFNGSVQNARGRVDVLADFIKLAPGPNTIEFEDTGNPEGEATLRIYYRSGWLG